jgi:hypothetical protein
VEIAATLNLPSAKAGEAKARRAKWERMLGNDGFARMAVPISAPEEPHPPRRPDAEGRRRPSEGPAHSPTVGALVAELKASHEQALSEMRRRAEAAEAQAGVVPALRERLGRVEGEATALRDAMARERQRADVEQQGREAAQRELAEWTAGGPVRRALRALVYRRP